MLGSLTAARDWGYAGDFVRAYWSMLQQPRPQDFVLGTGQLHTVEDFAKLAFEHVNLNWQDYVEVDSTFVGRQERVPLVANIARARQHLQWEPTTTLAALVARMVDHDLDSLAAASAEHKAA